MKQGSASFNACCTLFSTFSASKIHCEKLFSELVKKIDVENKVKQALKDADPCFIQVEKEHHNRAILHRSNRTSSQ